MVYTKKHTNNNIFLYSTLVLTSITSILAFILSSSPISAVGEDVTYTSTSANASVIVSAACTMTGSGMNSHTAEVPSGTYRADIGTTTIKVTCNDPHGFAIYAIGFSNDEYTGTNHTKLIGTNDSTKTIATGTATSGSTSNWAMKLATNSSATYPITLTNGYGSYSNVPDTYTKVAQRTSQTDIGTGATGAELTTTYAAFISSTQQPDTYVGKVRYTMVHPYDAPTPLLSYDMQNLSIDKCTTTSPINVVDVRDGEVYKAQRLADGKCWLLDNLRLDPTAVSLTDLQGNTNASNQTLTYFKNGGGTTSDQYATAGVSSSWSTDSYSAPLINADYKDATTTSYGDGSGKIGVYYNYCAASAGSYCYGNGASTGTSSGNATEDICPAGWRMPTGGDSGEYQALHTAYSSNATNFRNALSTPLSGYFSRGSAVYQGTYGFFWSSTRQIDRDMYSLNVNSSSVNPTNSSSRVFGSSVRCLLDS